MGAILSQINQIDQVISGQIHSAQQHAAQGKACENRWAASGYKDEQALNCAQQNYLEAAREDPKHWIPSPMCAATLFSKANERQDALRLVLEARANNPESQFYQECYQLLTGHWRKIN